MLSPQWFILFDQFNNIAGWSPKILNGENADINFITKNELTDEQYELLIDKEKIQRELDAYKKKPKKKSGFQARLSAALEEQQRIQQERENSRKKGRKKR